MRFNVEVEVEVIASNGRKDVSPALVENVVRAVLHSASRTFGKGPDRYNVRFAPRVIRAVLAKGGGR